MAKKSAKKTAAKKPAKKVETKATAKTEEKEDGEAQASDEQEPMSQDAAEAHETSHVSDASVEAPTVSDEIAPETTPVQASTEQVHIKPQLSQAIPKSAKHPKSEAEGWVYFVSVGDENTQFKMGKYTAMRLGKKIGWRVPADQATKMEGHHFVISGRVKRIKGDLKDYTDKDAQ